MTIPTQFFPFPPTEPGVPDAAPAPSTGTRKEQDPPADRAGDRGRVCGGTAAGSCARPNTGRVPS
ncbi:hypothetical protein [Streptacidiphilus sp. MAP5-52]|uniref:hypothetical protein n=1 Tax=Streptacidiphilus sp. MAP5-52 TaxID=3156267 RepID=UPI003516B216